MLKISWGAPRAGVPCCALELEQEIERLEAEASRDELLNFSFEGATCALPRLSGDGESMQDQTAHMSDADSDDGDDAGDDEEQEERAALIRQNALMVGQCGKTLLPGAWRGCAKSPLCDREDRHRGLCNHRATIPGPAACAMLVRPKQQMQDDEQDTSSMDQGVCEAPACSDVVMQSVEEEQASGGHSHNCGHAPEPCAHGDEREVDSALQTGDMEECSHQQEWAQAHLEQHDAAAAAAATLGRSSSNSEEDLFWCGNAGQLAAAELFSIPLAYQPRVKDLTAPDAPCLLSMDSNLSEVSTPLAAPMAVPSEEQHTAAAPDSTCSDCSDHTNTKACALNSGSSSAPCSPSCASAAAADFGPFQPQKVATVHADAASATPASSEEAQPAAASPCSSDSAAIVAAAFAAPDGAEAAVAAEPAAPNTAHSSAGAAQYVAAVTPAPIIATYSSTQAALELAAAEAAAAEAVAAAAAASAACLSSPTAAVSASGAVSPSAVQAFALQGQAGAQRPPRVKSKPSHTVMKAAAAVEASGSPKSKKRPASSRASGSGGHCCTSCGAVSTPVWRAGPAGPKTLCNACGVRYMKVAKRK